MGLGESMNVKARCFSSEDHTGANQLPCYKLPCAARRLLYPTQLQIQTPGPMPGKTSGPREEAQEKRGVGAVFASRPQHYEDGNSTISPTQTQQPPLPQQLSESQAPCLLPPLLAGTLC